MVDICKMYSLKGKACIVTGGSRGIGRGLLNSLAAAGANLFVISTKEEEACRAAQEVADEYSIRAHGFGCNVRYSDEVERTLDRCCEIEVPQLLLNNAGIAIHRPALEVSDEEWEKVIETNLSGPFWFCRGLARRLVAKGLPGSFVNLASNAAVMVPSPQPQASYNASKAGLVMLTKSLAYELVPHGIRVNSLSPGYVLTDMTAHTRPDWIEKWLSSIPKGRMGTPDELAPALIYLLSDMSQFTVGSDVIVDGGASTI
jgi:NAD(P)-dependent dehydrogenase (short-subunit alcohol dehydrogenase family)